MNYLRNREFTSSSRKKKPAPKTLFGFDVTKESLPLDIVLAVNQQLNEGNLREALSLIYRASLSTLLHKNQIPFEEFHTEGECLTLVKKHSAKNEAAFFIDLVQAWQKVAYGHQGIPSEEVTALCNGWQEIDQTHA